MSINALIARGITPIGEGVPQVLAMNEQMRQGRQRNALAARELDERSRQGVARNALAAEGQQIDREKLQLEMQGYLGDVASQALTLPAPNRRALLKQVQASPQFGQQFRALGGDPHSIDLDGMDDETLNQNLHTMAAWSRKPVDTGPLEQVLGPDGKPQYATRGQAVGRQPYLKPEGAPSSYDEFTRAQREPGYAQFLKDRRAKGMSITTPDGTVIDMGGEGGKVNADELTAPTRNKLQESIVSATDELDRLNSVGDGFDPKYLTVQGKALGAGLRLKDMAGGLLGQMDPKERDYLRRYSAFQSDSSRNLSLILNRLSGAAISPAEGQRISKGVPNDQDSPEQFQAKYQSSVKDVNRAIMRANWALKNGIGVKSVEDLSRSMPLSSIDRVYADRANEIWQQLGGREDTKAEAIQRANQEFGVGR